MTGPFEGLHVRLAYYGGLFDGEGSVFVSHQYRPSRMNKGLCLVVSVAMTDTIALRALLKDFGGSISTCGRMPKPTHHKQPYKWTVKARLAVAFLSSIRPYTLIKTDQIDVALMFQARINTVDFRGRGGLPMEEYEARLELMRRLRALKKVPVHGAANGIGANSVDGETPNTEPSMGRAFPKACVETMSPGQSLVSERRDIVQSIRN